MKLFLLTLSLLFLSLNSPGQGSTQDCNHSIGLGTTPLIDSIDFEATQPNRIGLIIDTSFQDNIWQLGKVQKNGFPGAFSGTRALQTDTLHPYPLGNESAAIIYLDSNSNFIQGNFASMSFWHYYSTDTLTDSCILEMTLDSGKTWSNLFATPWVSPGVYYYSGSLNNYSNNSSSKDTLFWSGESGGWRKESICLLVFGAKGMQIPKISGFRFRFHSDSVETNKAGWMIDNILFRLHEITPGSVHSLVKENKLIYPNPNNTGIIHVDYPEHHVKGTIAFYSSIGQAVKTKELSKTIDISDLPKGVYHYKAVFNPTNQAFSGTLIVD